MLGSKLVGRMVVAAALLISALVLPSAAAAQPLDNTYTVNTANGSFAFGNGATAASLPTGSLVIAAYRSGSGSTGNVTPSWSFGCAIIIHC